MEERGRVLLCTLAGAAIGAAAGFLMWTPSGRAVRDQFEPKLDEFLRNLQRLEASMHKARHVAAESWRSLQQVMEETPPPDQPERRWEGGSRPH